LHRIVQSSVGGSRDPRTHLATPSGYVHAYGLWLRPCMAPSLVSDARSKLCLEISLETIGVIYRGDTRSTYTPLFGLMVLYTPLFRTKRFAVNRDDLRRLNYNKTSFGRGSASHPAG